MSEKQKKLIAKRKKTTTTIVQVVYVEWKWNGMAPTIYSRMVRNSFCESIKCTEVAKNNRKYAYVYNINNVKIDLQKR